VDLLEHQGKEVFRRFGIPVSEGIVATTPGEARAAAGQLGGAVVVKAQVRTGGRGKAGGVKLARDADEAEAHAHAILGLEIRGHTVRRVLVEPATEIAREYYLSATFDRGAKATLLMFTTRGGVDVEQVAAEAPEALVRVHVDPLEAYRPHHGRRLVHGAGIADPDERAQLLELVERLHRCLVESDAMLCEINPLVVTTAGEVRALDAKVTVDDSALFRHPELAALADAEDADPLEALAREKDVTYVKLDGSVGILANGAGLAMSTVDVVVVAGGRPANFCDLGGGGTAQGVVDALEVIARDAQVRSILLNVFGGITRCDEVARGILEALERVELDAPFVVRLDGTNAEEGRRLLAEAAPPDLHVEPTMLDAARRAVELAA
jgi:succinyl-CoA synthetase beta subunit